MGVFDSFKKKRKQLQDPFGTEAPGDNKSFAQNLGSLPQKLGDSLASVKLPRRRLRMRHLRQGKRVVAGALFALYTISIPFFLTNPLLVLLLGTDFIVLDYLYKTRTKL